MNIPNVSLAGGERLPDTVLIVESSASIRSLLKNDIESALDVSVIDANSISDAKLAISGKKVHVAICGTNLSDSPRGEVISFLRENHIPTILYSASIIEELKNNYAKNYLIDYIIKDGHESVRQVVYTVARIINNANISILVVDDMKSMRSELVDFLRRQNFQVFSAKTGEEALQILDLHPAIEIVLTDYMMPDIDGFELTKRIRSLYGSDRIRIIGISASADRHLSASFLKAGASDFLYRPLLPEELQCRVNSHVETLTQLKKLRYLAERDPLTSLYNRRVFFEVSDRHLSLAADQEIVGCLAILDLDHFKAINDNFGHQVGDEVLKLVGEKLLQCAHRNDCLAARLGGEEFGILIRGRTVNDAVRLMEELRLEISELRSRDHFNDLRLTLSAGVVQLERGESMDNHFNAADQMLYLAKKEGRNCIWSPLRFDDNGTRDGR